VPIPFFGELGSANPLVVTASAADEPHRNRDCLAGSMTLGVGQFCTKPGLIFVPRGESGDALVAATIEALSSLGTFTMLSSASPITFVAVPKPSGRSPRARARSSRRWCDAHAAAQLYEVDAARFVGRDAYALREECFVRCAHRSLRLDQRTA